MNYKVLIVDDEAFVRMGIRSALDWGKYGYEVVGEAPNGSIALDLVGKLCPDLVLTDIKMPVIDGIELIRRISENHPGIKSVVLSNYSDFDLVREAMKAGACDYFLKIDIDAGKLVEILAAMHEILGREKASDLNAQRIEAVLNENRNVIINKWLEDLKNISESDDCFQNLSKRMQSAGIKVETEGGSVLHIHIVDYQDVLFKRFDEDAWFLEDTVTKLLNEIASIYSVSEVFYARNGHFIVIFSKYPGIADDIDLQIATHIRNAFKTFLELNSYIVYGIHYDNLACLSRHLRIYEEKGYPNFYSDGAALLEWKSHNNFNTGNYDIYFLFYNDLRVYARHCDSQMISKCFQNFLDKAEEKCVRPKEIKRDLLGLMNCVRDETAKLFREMGDVHSFETLAVFDFSAEVGRCSHISELRQVCRRFIRDYEVVVRKHGFEKMRSDIIKAMEYIKLNYSDRITLETVAEHLNMNACYFSRLFKNETGMNVTDFIKKVRIEKAAEFLTDGNLSISEIAYRVGYGDINYFDRVFRTYYKMTPSEFRKQNLLNCKDSTNRM
jgi:two-component system response regulator YesN